MLQHEWVNPENMTLSEISQAWKESTFLKDLEQSKTQWQKIKLWFPEVGGREGRMEIFCLMKKYFYYMKSIMQMDGDDCV